MIDPLSKDRLASMGKQATLPRRRSTGQVGPRTTDALAMAAKTFTVLASGIALGLAATALALDRRYDPAAVHIGPWLLWPKAGTADIDPYARAIMAQSGQVPLAAAEGVLLVARTDQAGDALVGRCTYRIGGAALPARVWSLSVTNPDGRIARNPIGRSGFTSSELLRRSDGSFTIELAGSARPGNWLPVPAGSFDLALHLDELPLGSPSTNLAKVSLPTIDLVGCRS